MKTVLQQPYKLQRGHVTTVSLSEKVLSRRKCSRLILQKYSCCPIRKYLQESQQYRQYQGLLVSLIFRALRLTLGFRHLPVGPLYKIQNLLTTFFASSYDTLVKLLVQFCIINTILRPLGHLPNGRITHG